MKTMVTVGKLVLGIVLGIGTQWLSLIFLLIVAIGILQSDPFTNFSGGSYTSVGLVISLICIGFFSWRREWTIVVGIVLGFVLWLPLFGIMLVSPGGAL